MLLRRHPHARRWRGVTKLRSELEHHGDQASVSRDTTRFALTRFQAEPSLRFVEMLPVLTFPRTTARFFAVYRIMALAPFVRVRSVIHVRSSDQSWPTFIRRSDNHPAAHWYQLVTWMLSIMNMWLIGQLAAIAVLGQPEYLLAYIGTFCLWVVWSVWQYPAISLSDKIIYSVLAPASLGYFLWRGIRLLYIPVRILTRLVRRRRPVLS